MTTSYNDLSKTVFISGPGRSGSTMLQAMLDYHPELAVFPLEFNLLFTYVNVLKLHGRVTARLFADYLKRYTRLRFLGLVMPMQQGQDIDFRGLDAETFWEPFLNVGDKDRRPAELLVLLAEAFIRSSRVSVQPFAFVLRSNNLYLNAYRAAFPGAKFLYTLRNPVDLFIGYLKYHAVDSYTYRRAVEYHDLVDRTLKLIRVSLLGEAHGYHATDTHYVRLEDLKTPGSDPLREVAAFLDVPFLPSMAHMTILGKPYGGNRVQKINPGLGGFRNILRGKGYITPSERNRLNVMLNGLVSCPYPVGRMREYMDRVCLHLPSVFFTDLIRNRFSRGLREKGAGGHFHYKFPLDFQI